MPNALHEGVESKPASRPIAAVAPKPPAVAGRKNFSPSRAATPKIRRHIDADGDRDEQLAAGNATLALRIGDRGRQQRRHRMQHGFLVNAVDIPGNAPENH